LQFLAQGYSCPRKALINSPVELLDAVKPDALMNVNHPEELAQAKKWLTVK
jgi:molybdopterin-guanine dinucleotide biosynthesis protein A